MSATLLPIIVIPPEKLGCDRKTVIFPTEYRRAQPHEPDGSCDARIHWNRLQGKTRDASQTLVGAGLDNQDS